MGVKWLDRKGKWQELQPGRDGIFRVPPEPENRRSIVDDTLHQSSFGVMTVKKFKKSTPSSRLKNALQRKMGF